MIRVATSDIKRALLYALFNSATVRAVLLKSTATISPANVYLSEVNTDEISATGNYATNGITLTGKAFSTDTVNEQGVMTANRVNLFNVTIPDVQFFVLVIWTGNAATSPIIDYSDNGSPVSYTGQNVSLVFDTNGVCRVS